MHTVDCIFFSRVHTAGTLSGGWRGAKNRPKTTRKALIAGKSVCISATILTCFAYGRTYALVCNGPTHRGFHRARRSVSAGRRITSAFRCRTDFRRLQTAWEGRPTRAAPGVRMLAAVSSSAVIGPAASASAIPSRTAAHSTLPRKHPIAISPSAVWPNPYLHASPQPYSPFLIPWRLGVVVIIRSTLEPLHRPRAGRPRWSRRTAGCRRKSPGSPPLQSSRTASRAKTDGRS